MTGRLIEVLPSSAQPPSPSSSSLLLLLSLVHSVEYLGRIRQGTISPLRLLLPFPPLCQSLEWSYPQHRLRYKLVRPLVPFDARVSEDPVDDHLSFRVSSAKAVRQRGVELKKSTQQRLVHFHPRVRDVRRQQR